MTPRGRPFDSPHRQYPILAPGVMIQTARGLFVALMGYLRTRDGYTLHEIEEYGGMPYNRLAKIASGDKRMLRADEIFRMLWIARMAIVLVPAIRAVDLHGLRELPPEEFVREFDEPIERGLYG